MVEGRNINRPPFFDGTNYASIFNFHRRTGLAIYWNRIGKSNRDSWWCSHVTPRGIQETWYNFFFFSEIRLVPSTRTRPPHVQGCSADGVSFVHVRLSNKPDRSIYGITPQTGGASPINTRKFRHTIGFNHSIHIQYERRCNNELAKYKHSSGPLFERINPRVLKRCPHDTQVFEIIFAILFGSYFKMADHLTGNKLIYEK